MTTISPPPVEATPRVPDDCHDIDVAGRLDAAAAQGLRARVAEAIQDGPVLVLVDVTGVTEVTPSGLVGVLECLRLARARGGDLRMHGASATVLDAQTVANLTQVARVYGGRDAAIDGGVRRNQPPVRVRRRRRSFHDRMARMQASLLAQAGAGVLYPDVDGAGALHGSTRSSTDQRKETGA